jgi:hypothetical protein
MSASAVAQIVNLPCRRLVIGGAVTLGTGERAGGLPVRDTADCQSALPGVAVVDDLRDIVELLEKEEGVAK